MAEAPARNIRISDELWNAAKKTAADNGEQVSAVVRRLLTSYVKGQS